MRIHQRTEEEQKRIAERGKKILVENPEVLAKDVAGRFGMRDTEFIALLKKYGYQRERRKGRSQIALDWIDTWRNNCGHLEGKDKCIACSSKDACLEAIREIRKLLREEK